MANPMLSKNVMIGRSPDLRELVLLDRERKKIDCLEARIHMES